MSHSPELQVVKIGGSLLASPAALRNAKQWLSGQSHQINVVLTGGGQPVNEIRRWQQQLQLTDGTCHLNALQTMSMTLSRLATLWDMTLPVRQWQALLAITQSCQATTVLFDCCDYMQTVQKTLPGYKLTSNWDATSDSIAARIGYTVGAYRVVLLKSAPARTGDLKRLALANYVDREFPRIASHINSVTFVDCNCR